MTTKVPVDLRRFTVFFVDVVKTVGGMVKYCLFMLSLL